MSFATDIAVVIALLGSALIAGIFFAFSSFIMKALAEVPSGEGIVAMQSINVVVVNPFFLGAFMGTAVVSLLVAVLAVNGWATPTSPLILAGAVLYIVGTVLVTGLGNVPLNEQLAAVSSNNPDAVVVWELYLDRWTRFNTIRTLAAAAAALMFTLGLMQNGSP